MEKINEETKKEWSVVYFQFILDHPDKPWDWTGISINTFIIASECYMQKHLAQKAAKLFVQVT